MSKKRRTPRKPAPLVPQQSSDNLPTDVEKMSDDARWRWILRGEGGERTPAEFALAVLIALGTAGLVAWAIVAGEATVWHLALPLVAQYLAYIFFLPVAYGLLHHPALRSEAVASLRMWIILPMITVAVLTVRHFGIGEKSWLNQLSHDIQQFLHWVFDAKMHWPILLAIVSVGSILATSIRSLYRHGPPFDGGNLGCAVKAVMTILGLFVVPFLMTTPVAAVWMMWGILLLADLLAIAAHWDIQRRLRRFEEAAAAEQEKS